MKVLIDFTQIPLIRTGVGVYADNLVSNLVKQLRPGDELILVAQSDDQILRQMTTGLSNVRLLTIPSRVFRSRVLLFVFEQTVLPALALVVRADLIHSLHYTHPLISLIPRIVTIHDLTFLLFPEFHTGARRLIMPFFVRRAMLHAEALIFVSKATQADAERMLPKGHNLRRVVPLGVSRCLPLPASGGSFPSSQAIDAAKEAVDGPYLLFIGTLEPRKNIVRLVQAFERIAGDYPTLNLVLAGKLGWHTEEIVASMRNSPVKSRIRHLGFISEREKMLLLRDCTVLVYPSLYEGFGLPVLEGMAAGAPVITSNISSLPEVAGDAALLVDPLDVQAIASAIRHLMSDEGARRAIAERGTMNAERFTWESTARGTYDTYREMVSGR